MLILWSGSGKLCSFGSNPWCYSCGKHHWNDWPQKVHNFIRSIHYFRAIPLIFSSYNNNTLLRSHNIGGGSWNINDDQLSLYVGELPHTIKRVDSPLLLLCMFLCFHPCTHIINRVRLQLTSNVRTRYDSKHTLIGSHAHYSERVTSLPLTDRKDRRGAGSCLVVLWCEVCWS